MFRLVLVSFCWRSRFVPGVAFVVKEIGGWGGISVAETPAASF